ncbi:MAG: energy transducer TonB, partial [Gammaproteobacteria bacterium]
PRTALVLGANGGQVLDRVHRLLGQPATDAAISWLPLLLAGGLLLAGSLMSVVHQNFPRQSVLATRYTLMVKPAQSASQTAGPSAIRIVPTQIKEEVSTRPTPQPIQLFIKKLPNRPLSSLSAIAMPAQPAIITQAAAHDTPAPYRAGGEVIERYSPRYPPIAMERGVEGAATVAFALTTQGDVSDAHVTQFTGSRLFGSAAIAAISKWKFTPITVAGTPMAQDMTVEFVFKLNDSATSSGPCKIPMGYHVCTN